MRRMYVLSALAFVSLVFLFSGHSLRAQCTPTPGPYQMFISPAIISTTMCPGATSTIEVRADPIAPQVVGFGFNIEIGTPGTILSVIPGFNPSPGGGFTGVISGSGNAVAALGIINPGGPPLTLLATIVFEPVSLGLPTTVGITFGGTLALPNGIVPIDHLVEQATGCDVLPPTLAIVGGTLDLATCPGNIIRGDCNNNGQVVGLVGDIWFLLNSIFLGGPAAACDNACDANDDEQVGIGDAVYLLNWEFLFGPPPSTPTPAFPAVTFLSDCGPDPTPGGLTCASPICP